MCVCVRKTERGIDRERAREREGDMELFWHRLKVRGSISHRKSASARFRPGYHSNE